ncbi:hypothetical protein TUM4438_39350 [Shewanella sairae]|uniref:RHS repeat protein n=1 Tax=Shewanella sairae TaxID=190310 RepID=A0ABQ4PQB2_9GAMM|nr:RHS repeat-associated core domain-containing protein [Shewanella sairae]MCL1132235.1 DUF6531 domain-containing protein [Shewanella sairae]GIU51064.1 hypothetical protein TUM4438_39350 [Shewanella sairae]
MSNDRKAELISSEQAAEQNFSTDNVVSGGCVECGCTALIHYHYDDGKPVPEAPFILTDSNNKEIQGKTDKKGLCLIKDMGCGGFDMLLDEGSDDFEPPKTVINNPVIQDNPEYAALAGEYFTLFTLLRNKGYLEYDASDSSDNEVDVDDTSFFMDVIDEYKPAYKRFWQLDKQINEGSKSLKIAINKIHTSLPAEVVSQAGDNSAILLFCQVAVGFIPVVGQAVDIYDLGDWGWQTYRYEENRSDPWHWAAGSLVVIGFIPGLGDAIKKSGGAIIDALKKSDAKAIQLAIKTLRGLSNGNLIKFLSTFEKQIREKGKDAVELLNKIIDGLKRTIANAANSSWIIRLMKGAFEALIDSMSMLSQKMDEVITWISQKVSEFIGKVVTKVSGTPRPKNTTKPNVEVNAGKNSGEVDNAGAKAEVDKRNDELPSQEGVCTNGCPIDMATGFVVDWRTDFTLNGRLPLIQKRFYHSAGLMLPGLLGSRWRSIWDMSLELEGQQATFTDEQYTQAVYLLPKEGEESLATHLPEWRLTRQNKQLLMRHVSGLIYCFDHAMGTTLLLTKISDGKGNNIHFLYDRGTLKQIVLADGQQVKVECHHHRISKLTLLDSELNPIQTLAYYEYDKHGQLLSCRAAPGCSFDYQYSEEGYLLRWSDLSQTWVEHDYDDKGRAIASRGAEGRFSDQIRFDDAHRIVYYKSAIGGIKQYYHDERNNIVRIIFPNGDEIHNEWLDNQLVAQSNALGERTEFSYDAWGQIEQVIAADGSVTSYQYDDSGRLIGNINPLGAAWKYEYDVQGNLTCVSDPLNQQWFYQYTRLGQVAWVISPEGAQTGYQYNDSGQLTEILPPLGEKLILDYDALGRLSTQTRVSSEASAGEGLAAERKRVQRWHYQGSLPYPRAITHEDGTQSVYDYDIEGNVTRFTDALGHQFHYEYGAFDKMLASIDPQGAKTQYSYNGECQFEGVINSQQQAWRYHYNTSGQIIEERHYDGRITQFTYDGAGRISSKTAADGTSLHYFYDTVGRLTQKQSRADDARITGNTYFEYDEASQLLKAENAHALIEFEYDELGRRITEQLNGHRVSSQYTNTGLRSRIKRENTEGEAYHPAADAIEFNWQLGQLKGLQIGAYHPLAFSHNQLGQETKRSNGLGFHLAQQHGPDGLLLNQQLIPSAHHAESLMSEGIDPLNNVHQATARGKGDSRYQHLQRSYQYNALNQISQIDDSHWGLSEFEHNSVGQITQHKQYAPGVENGTVKGAAKGTAQTGQAQQTQAFSYDSEQNLTQSSQVLSADNGNVIDFVQKRVEKALKYQQAGRVETVGEHTYRYDANGRAIEKCTRKAGFRPQSTFYQWDEEDQLIQVRLANGDCWHYQYDPFGRRIAKIKQSTKQQEQRNSPSQFRYLWDGNNLVEQQKCYADGTLAHTTQWVYEPNSFRPLAQLTQSYTNGMVEPEALVAEMHYIVTDQAGTPRELCTENGDIEWRGEQSLWGEHHKWRLSVQAKSKHKKYLEDAANDPVNCELRYQGQVFDSETGLYYNRHRYYDPETCQYLSPDPIGMAGGLRPQAYVHNPLEWVVPLGLAGCPVSTLGRKAGGSGVDYDKVNGQGIYVLRDPISNEIKYVGRGDAPARGYAHGIDKDKGHLVQEIIHNNNLTKAEAKHIEQSLMDKLGGAQSTNPVTNLFNKIRSYSPTNPNATTYGTAGRSSEHANLIFDETMKKLGF